MFSSKALVFITAVLMCVRGVKADSKCTVNFGFCQDVDNSCSGSYLSYLCDGPYTRRCCVPAFNDEKCHARDGKCQSTSITCFGGSYVPGLCGGPLEKRRCCISNVTDSAYNDEKCQTKGGQCQYTNITCVDGSYVINLCGGPTNRRCCLPHVTGVKADNKCTVNFGFCQDVENSCSGPYLSYLCDGPYTRRCCVPAFNDEKCHARDGKCQSTSITCFGGNYVTGLCGGPLERRCCISNVTDNDSGNPECGEQAQRLACQLVDSPNVFFLGRQTSSATDKPEANLRDMCEGRKAIRSQDRCDSGCSKVSSKFVCLHTPLLEYLMALQDNGPIVIDELTGACHKRSCRHQEGRAVDLHRDGRISHYIRQCHAMGGTAVPRASVLHCQF